MNTINDPKQFISKSKTIGIMGGLGPFAAIEAEKILLSHYVKNGAKKDQDFPHFVINMYCKTPDRTSYLLDPEHNTNPTSALVNSLKELENAGANIIFIPCNTAHAFIGEINKAKKPETIIVDMIEETGIFAKSKGFKELLLLATDGTLKTRVYNKYLDNIVSPEIGSEEQQIVMDIIYGENGVKAGYSAVDKRLSTNKTPWWKLQTVLKSFPNVDAVILGCTELPIAVPQEFQSEKFINPLDVVVKKSISLLQD
ncbi:MAG: amino acid racemase [Proteobacteria bacterium]|nr:amino acid racemase [Pseudomonadota bacterium]